MEIHSETLSRFYNQHKIIKHYIDDLPPEAIYNRLSAQKWSIHETIAYLCRYQYVFMDRLNQIINEINPFFEIYNKTGDFDYHFIAAKTSGSLLHEIYRVRDEMKIILERLSVGQQCRVGTHAKLGKMNINQWLEFFLLHESNQLYKIFKLVSIFWSMNSNMSNVINLPRLQNHPDDFAR